MMDFSIKINGNEYPIISHISNNDVQTINFTTTMSGREYDLKASITSELTDDLMFLGDPSMQKVRELTGLDNVKPIDIKNELKHILAQELGVEVYQLVTGSLPLNFQPNVDPETIPDDYNPFEIIY